MTSKLLYDLPTRGNKTLLFRYWSSSTGISNKINQNKRISPSPTFARTSSTVDTKDFFQVKGSVSWDPEGPLKIIHALNHIRVPYIRDSLVKVEPGKNISNCLKGMKILDVGCGGGILSEALAKLGAEVTGIDSSHEALSHAKQHSSKNIRLANNLPIYIPTTIEEHCEKHAESYDAIVAAEVIDHVGQKELFVESCVRAAKPGAKLFFTTINRTLLTRFVYIFAFENIFKVIPKGAHKYDMFITPSELQYVLEMNDCFVKSIKGYYYDPFQKSWKWCNHNNFSYTIEAVKST